MSQIITINVGGAGVNIGKAALELSAEEHGIGYDGYLEGDEEVRRIEEDVKHDVLFRESSAGTWTPRSLFFDVQSDQIGSLLSDPVGELVETWQYLTANRASTGVYTDGFELAEPALETFRREAEQCDVVKDVILFNATGGGTGSGLSDKVSRSIKDNDPKMSILQYCVMPELEQQAKPFALYNNILSWRDKYEINNTEVWLDNEALSHYCREKCKIVDPSFGDINRLIVEQVSSFTHARRFGGGTGFRNF